MKRLSATDQNGQNLDNVSTINGKGSSGLTLSSTYGSDGTVIKGGSGSGYLIVQDDAVSIVGSNLAMGSHRITGVSGPSSAQDAANKAYVDTAFANAGDVVGPVGASAGAIAKFSGTTGKVLQNSAKFLPSGEVVGTSDEQTLSNKTISGSSNTISNIGLSSLVDTGWVSGSFNSGFTGTLQYRMICGVVYLRGTVTKASGFANTTFVAIATIPDTYLPTSLNTVISAMGSGTKAAGGIVLPKGDGRLAIVSLSGATQSTIDFTGSWLAD